MRAARVADFLQKFEVTESGLCDECCLYGRGVSCAMGVVCSGWTGVVRGVGEMGANMGRMRWVSLVVDGL